MNQQAETADVTMTPSSKKKPWEHAWTIDEMRKAAENWSLASDVGMLLHLQDFSQKLLSQTHEIQEQVDSLNHEAKLTNIRLHNVFNDFIMLANTQFVENRVYDEEVVGQEQIEGSKKKDDIEKTPQQKESELIPKIKEAISLGLSIFDTAYEKIDMNIANSESEDEDATNKPHVILEAKDPYLHRPLPCLIGSDQFFKLDDLGLTYVIDNNDEQESDHMSDGQEECVPTEIKPRPATKPVAADSDESGEEDLFSEVKTKNNMGETELTDSEDEEADVKVKNPLSDLHSELANKLTGAIPSKPPVKHQDSIEETPKAKPRSAKPQKMQGQDDLFTPVTEDPVDDIFSRPSRLFSSRPTLFDNNEDEEDNDESGGLFGPPKSKPTRDKPAVLTTGSAVDQDPSDLASSYLVNKPPAEKKENVEVKKAKSLFDEEEDDDGDLFTKQPLPAAKQTKDTKKAVSLFGDEDDDEESDIFSDRTKSSNTANKSTEAQNKPRIPAGAVSIFGGGNDLHKAVMQKTKKNFDDEDDASSRSVISDKSLSKPSQLTKSFKLPPAATDTLKPPTGSSTPSSTMSSSSLFAEDPEQLLAASTTKAKGSDLNKEPSRLKTNLFDDGEDDDLFASSSKPVTSTAAKPSEPKKKTARLLFEDEDGDDGDLFAIPTSPRDKKTITLVDEAVPKEVSKETKPVETQEPSKPAKSKVSLFNDSDDELFNTILKKSPAKARTSVDKSPGQGNVKSSGAGHSLFDDDDFLFSAQDDSPSVDLFKPAVKKVENKVPTETSAKSLPKVQPSSDAEAAGSKKPSALPPKKTSRKLFGSVEDEDDDLFSTLKATPSQNSKASSKASTSDQLETTASSVIVAEKAKSVDENLFSDSSTKKKLNVPAEDLFKESNPLPVQQSFIDPLNSATENKAQNIPARLPKARNLPAKSTDHDPEPLGQSDALFSEQSSFTKDIDKDLTKSVLQAPKSPTLPKVLPKSSAKSDLISNLQASMKIDPTAHLPQQKRKPAAQDSEAVDFQLPAQTQTLHSLAKDRAKIPVKRRPPTRRHVGSQEDPSQLDAIDSLFQESDKKDSSFKTHPVPSVQKSDVSILQADTSSDNSLFFASSSDPKQKPIPETLNSFAPPKLNLLAGKEAVDESLENDIAPSRKPPPLFMEDDDGNSDDDLFGSGSKSKLATTKQKVTKVSVTNKAESKVPEAKSTSTKDHTADLVSGKKDDKNSDLFGKNELTSSKSSTSATTKPVADEIMEVTDQKLMVTNSDVKKTLPSDKILWSGDDTKRAKDDDDLFGGGSLFSSSGKMSKPTKDTKVMQSVEKSVNPAKISLGDDDLFGSSKVFGGSTSKAVPEKATNSAAIKETETSKPGKDLVFLDDSDDIFNKPKQAPASSTVKSKPVAAFQPADDDDDDIFASSSLVKKAAIQPSTNKEKAKESNNNTPAAATNDDDDIFASLAPASTKSKAPVSKSKPTNDDDDLFMSSSQPSSRRPAYKKPVTKDEDLFHDDTDIFAEIPNLQSTKSKEKKILGKPSAAPTFADDPDDIFAEAASAVVKSKVAQVVQKPTAQTKPKDDIDDIFEDPLNVLKK